MSGQDLENGLFYQAGASPPGEALQARSFERSREDAGFELTNEPRFLSIQSKHGPFIVM
ncbi:MAG TPA: hypothetical protein VK972_09810 [Wenzhouxiangella sp.]|nr:hypothetical protein [Wenzhouxiangella sp.]